MAGQLAQVPRSLKDAALQAIAAAIRAQTAAILAANDQDVQQAHTGQISGPVLDRLLLTPERIEAMARGIEAICALPDPIGTLSAAWSRPNGLLIQRVRVPLGVIGIIFESRPNVTADAGALCLKSGNAAILRGGSEVALRWL